MIFYLRPVNVREEDDYRLQSFSYPRLFSIYSYYRMLEFFNMNHIVWIILYETYASGNLYHLKWLHRRWWRSSETKCVGDKFEMLVTDSVTIIKPPT